MMPPIYVSKSLRVKWEASLVRVDCVIRKRWSRIIPRPGTPGRGEVRGLFFR